MISHEHKFIFLHFPKTGGTSIEFFFSGKVEPRPKHLDAAGWEINAPSEWAQYFKFTVIRNPWDRAVSQWCFQKQRAGNAYKKTFKQFVRVPTGIPLQPHLWFLSPPRYREKDQIISYVESNIDFILRYENLQDDFNKLCDRLSIPRATLPRKYSSSSVRQNKPYQDYYDEQTQELIARIYDLDINYFNYEF